jgi:hypothetical protein
MRETDFGGVSYQAEMPLGWEPMPQISAMVLQEWMHTNAVLLHALATMETQPPERDQENSSDIERIEAKLDLALNLLAKLLSQHAARPESRPASLSAAVIEWLDGGAQAPATGSDILISLYIHPQLAQPLLLPAKVRSSQPVAGGTRVAAEFTRLSEEVGDWLERTVFRNHRRFIQSRHRDSG